MADITIDGLSDDTVEDLRARASRRGASLVDYLRDELVALARRPDVAALMADVQARRARHGGQGTEADTGRG